MAGRGLIVGIDGGGTRTRCIAVDGAGRFLGAGETGPLMGLYAGQEAAEDALDEALGRCMADLPESGGLLIKRVVGQGKFADLPLTLVPLTAYTTSLGKYSGGSGDLVMDDRTTFRPIQPTNWDVFTLCANLNIPIITVAEAKTNPSKKTSDGFTVPTDWRCIIGNVSGPSFSGKAKDAPEGIMFGTVTITDPTVLEQPFTDNQGRNVFPGIKCWCASEFAMMVEENAYCAFLGSIYNKKDATTQIEKPEMQVALIIPIFQTTGLEVR